MMKTRTTKRLILKLSNKNDLKWIIRFVQRNKEFLKEWEPSREKDYYTYDYQLNEIKNELVRIKRGEMYKFWIFKDNEAIGSIVLNNVIRGAFQSCHLGYRIDEDEQRKGDMTEALEAIINYAFSNLLLHRIEANIMPRNLASIRVVEKLGFLYEGMSKKYLKINGNWEDHIHMVLLNEKME